MSALRAALTGAALLATAFYASFAQADTPPSEEGQLSEDEQSAIDFSIARGAEIYAHDVAAWVATDVLLEHPAPDSLGIRGWVVTPIKGKDGLYQVTFVSGESPDWRIAAMFAVDEGKVIDFEIFENAPARFALNGEQTDAFEAQQAASAALEGLPMCSETVNTVVIPTSTGHDAYFLTPQASMDEIQFGRHYRIPVSEDGVAGEVFSFTRTCIAVNNAAVPGDSKTVMAFVSDLSGQVPSEVHVFKSLEHRTPVAVMTVSNGRAWLVNGTTIEQLNTREQQD